MKSVLKILGGAALRVFTRKKGGKLIKKHGVVQEVRDLLHVTEPGEPVSAEVIFAYILRTAVLITLTFLVIKFSQMLGIPVEEFLRWLGEIILVAG